MIRVVQFAHVINRLDVVDVIVQRADPQRFAFGVCVGRDESTIAPPVYERDVPRWLLPWKERRGVVGTAWRLATLLRRWHADILHTHHYDEAVIGWLATRLYRRCRLVVGRHYSDSIYRLPSGLKRRALLALEAVANRGATRIVVPSVFIRDLLTTRQNVPGEKIDLVPSGFAPEKYAAISPDDAARMRRELGLEDRLVIGTFGRLEEGKGLRFLLEAMTGLQPRGPAPALLIVGEGAERAAIERQVEALGLGDTVRLLGWRRDALTVMAAVDMVVQPTLAEAFSQVMAEALWLGKALVMTDVSGVADVIRHRENGVVVPTADPRALAAAIDELAADAALRARLGAAGRAFAEANLAIDRVVPLYERTYLKALGR